MASRRDTAPSHHGVPPLRDWRTPGAAPPVAERAATLGGAAVRRADWDPGSLARLAAALRAAAPHLAALPRRRLLSAWSDTVAVFRDPDSAERRALAPALAVTTALSPQGLAAGLEAVLGGVSGPHAARVVAPAQPPDNMPGTLRAAVAREVKGSGVVGGNGGLTLVALASNLPALAVQPLLPLLAAGRPTLLKSPSAEPLFAAAFIAALARREPVLGEAVAALTWAGGDRALEAPLLAAADTVVAYGEADTLADLESRAAGRVIAYGPKTSLAVVCRQANPDATAAGLARDVALFDQRGCLSVVAVYTEGEEHAGRLASALARELTGLARRWPPGPADPAVAAAVRHLRDAAVMGGLAVAETALAEATVVVDPDPAFRPTPGLRTVRVHPLPDLDRLPRVLEPWSGRLQGVAWAAGERPALHDALSALGVSRFAPPGELQTPDTRWHNGGVDLLELLS